LKGNLLAGVAAVALMAAAPALAADLPLKVPPAAAAVWSWSGFYVGAHGGYGWGHDSLTDLNDPFFAGKFPNFTVTGFDPKGALGGLQAGANWQAGRLVGGLEGDLSFADIKGSSSGAAAPLVLPGQISTGSIANSGAFDLLGSGRGRLGYLATPNVLLYGTGGVGWTRFVQHTDLAATTASVPPPGSFSILQSLSVPTWRVGWVAGVGAEARLFDTNWLARLEYLHYGYGNSGSNATTGFNPVQSQSTGNLTLDVVRAGLSYKFDPDRFALGYAGAVAPASAGMYAKAPVVAAQPWSWSGFYLGGHAGYGWVRDPFSNLNFLDNTITLSGVDSSGFVGGAQAGANWQSGRVVGGLEIDLSGSAIKGSASNSVTAFGAVSQATQTDKTDWFGSARARLGYLVTPSLLLYGTGGPGWARMVTDQETVITVPAAPPPSTTSLVTPTWMFGWTAGVGAEARLWNTNWLARLEYLHYDFGSRSFNQTIPAPGGGPVVTTSFGHVTNDLVRAGLNYKLDWPGVAGTGAAAIPVKAAAAAIWSWSGFYLGGNVGYGWGRDPFSNLVTPTLFTAPQVNLNGVNSSGYVAGFDAGANWQTGSVVGGLEIDLSSSGIKGSSSVSGVDFFARTPLTVMQTDKLDLLGSGRARLGYLVWPNVLLYGTGGLGWTHLDQSVTTITPTLTTIASTPSWRFGWVAGAGGEARLWNSNWTARLEYLHYDFGNSGSNTGSFVINGISELVLNTTSRHLTTDVVRTGIGYKFD
jgi:opacity protein-like surface antigen